MEFNLSARKIVQILSVALQLCGVPVEAVSYKTKDQS